MSRTSPTSVLNQTSIFIDENGDIEAINDHFVDGLDLGVREMQRVSDVEFDSETQMWYAEIREDFLASQHVASIRLTAPTRQEALDREVVFVNSILHRRIIEGKTIED